MVCRATGASASVTGGSRSSTRRPEARSRWRPRTGGCWITFNGEIYNYDALRDELIGQGIVFRTHSDTEVLLYLYLRARRGHGAPAARHVRVRDLGPEARSLFLARDPYGIKPLYYAAAGGVFRFASQVKALLAGGAVSRDTRSGRRHRLPALG